MHAPAYQRLGTAPAIRTEDDESGLVDLVTADAMIWIPEGWRREAGDGSLVLASRDGRARVVCAIVPRARIHEANLLLNEWLAEVFASVAWRRPVRDGQHGLARLRATGSAWRDGRAFAIEVRALGTPAEAVLVFASTNDRVAKRDRATIHRVLDSIRPR
jgi:hypothetical protein